MELSVVVPTLNGRDRLRRALDALAEHAPDAEVVVANGPSADGTTGMVREHPAPDHLVEVSSRNPNVARNAGIEVTTGDVVALVGYDLAIDADWRGALAAGLEAAAVVTGPTHRTMTTGVATETEQRVRLGNREVTLFNGRNVAFRRAVLEALDGFDEYLLTGGDYDAAHRLAAHDYGVAWRGDMCVRQELGADGGSEPTDWEWRYRARAYTLVKNYGLRPRVAASVVRDSLRDAWTAARETLAGNGSPTRWLGNGRDVVSGIATGVSDGLMARTSDRSPTRNPHGLSARADRAVTRYDLGSDPV
jgi:glycosyltransferase involved in cell wall biosynthesis